LGARPEQVSVQRYDSGFSIVTDPRRRIAFVTITSRGYIDQAAGLFLNLREFYPTAEFILCALDTATERAFANTANANLTCVSAVDIWGEDNWRNMTSRMSVPERAFASKSALVAWAVENREHPVLLLDSDLLFLSRIDDVIDCLQSHPLLLVPGRHPWDAWRKSANFGLFSAGIIGVAPAARAMTRAWRAMCFEACMATSLSGLYYEQKYLDYFVSVDGLKILNDPGINVSQTLLKLLAPQRLANGAWQVGDGTALRIYHASRSTDEEFELARIKADYNRRGLAAFGLSDTQRVPREQRTGNRIGLASFARALRIGSMLEGFAGALDRSSRGLITLHRVLTLHDHTLATRIKETFTRRRQLQATLERSAYPEVTLERSEIR
jgi:hypothetical protein